MKNILMFLLFSYSALIFAQQDSTNVYKKRVLENTEIDFIASYYSQDGDNASVTGGIGTEELTDFAPSITVSIPINADDILTVDVGVSAYTSASSSNLDPFDNSGASAGGDDDDDDDEGVANITGSPWVASSGASQKDVWFSPTVSYSHSSDDRNKIWSANASFATEYDYTSFGFGGSYSYLFNEKNTEIGIKGNVYLDTWKPKYPTELDSYLESGNNLNQGFFSNVDILDETGAPIDKNGNTVWRPLSASGLINDKTRNSYSLSLSFSQILSKNAQFSVFLDVLQQNGWLANPTQRIYFQDRANYYVGNAGENNTNITNYASQSNTELFQLADDIERLPNTRFKIPLGMRFNYYINEIVSLRTYYRYYFDDWGVNSHTASIEVPVKVSKHFTLYPSYRYYTQTAADYFAPFEQHLSTSEFYTSDFDLSKYNANQFSFGVSYTDIFSEFLAIKSIDLKYTNYKRNIGLKANNFALGIKFVLD